MTASQPQLNAFVNRSCLGHGVSSHNRKVTKTTHIKARQDGAHLELQQQGGGERQSPRAHRLASLDKSVCSRPGDPISQNNKVEHCEGRHPVLTSDSYMHAFIHMYTCIYMHTFTQIYPYICTERKKYSITLVV